MTFRNRMRRTKRVKRLVRTGYIIEEANIFFAFSEKITANVCVAKARAVMGYL